MEIYKIRKNWRHNFEIFKISFILQLNLASPLSLGLRGLKNANPRFSDFTLDSASSVIVGKRIFYSATWNDQNVTICIAFNPTMHVSRKDFYLAPIIEFIDAVPEEISQKIGCNGRKTIEGLTINFYNMRRKSRKWYEFNYALKEQI